MDVPPGGYAWWYLDALSEDRRLGVTVIAFVGSVFSPFYFDARRRGGGVADPGAHCAINVCLYGAGFGNWAMTEVSAGQVSRSARHFQIGRSSLGWEGDDLVVRIDEPRAPWPGRLVGTVRLRPRALHRAPVPLDAAGRHGWWGVAPHATAEVELSRPELRFTGSAYHDSNWGQEPIEAGFHRWCWSRAEGREGTTVLFDVLPRGASEERPLGWRFRGDGAVDPVDIPRRTSLGRTWGFQMPRVTRTDAGAEASVRRTVEDTPFYARSWVDTTLLGERVTAVHESLDLDRFKSPVVQFMLPYRMRREGGAS